MESPQSAPGTRPFGLVETTIIVVVIGVTALFAIPRFEARSEVPVVSRATDFCEWIQIHQAVRYRKGVDYSEHIAAFHDRQGSVRSVPDEFSIKSLEVDGRKHWELRLLRRETGSSFGAYEIVWDSQGFNETKSSVPRGLLPEELLD